MLENVKAIYPIADSPIFGQKCMARLVLITFEFVILIQSTGCFGIRKSADSVAQVGNMTMTPRKKLFRNDTYKTEFSFHARLHGKDTLIHDTLKTSWPPATYGVYTDYTYHVLYDTTKPQLHILLAFQQDLSKQVEIDTTVATVKCFFGTKGPPDLTGIWIQFQPKDSANQMSERILTPGMRGITYPWLKKVRIAYQRDNPYKLQILFPQRLNKYVKE